MLGLACNQGSLLWRLLRDDWRTVSASEVARVLHCDPNNSRSKLYGTKLELRNSNPNSFRDWLASDSEHAPSSFQQRMFDAGHDNEPKMFEWYIGWNASPNRIYVQPGIITRCDLPIRFSPDLIEFAVEYPSPYLVRGIEFKTVIRREVPLDPTCVYWEHIFQSVQSSVGLRGLEAPSHSWRLIYNKIHTEIYAIYDIGCDREGAEMIMDKVADFILAVQHKDHKNGTRRKNHSDHEFLEALIGDHITIRQVHLQLK